MAEIQEGPKIHNPQELVNKWEEDRHNANKEKTRVMNLRHIEELEARVNRLEFELAEIKRLMEIATEPLRDRKAKLKATK